MMSFTEDEQVSGRGEDASFPIVLRCFHAAEARMQYAVFGIMASSDVFQLSTITRLFLTAEALTDVQRTIATRYDR